MVYNLNYSLLQKISVLFPVISFSITNCNLTLWMRRDKSLHTHTQTLIYDLCDAPASVFTVNWTSPKCTPQRTLQPLFSSTPPGDAVRMKQRYERLELPLHETYQRRQSQQHTLPVELCRDWTNSGRARMKKVRVTEELLIYSDLSWVKRC